MVVRQKTDICSQNGFTLIELLMAMAVFSFMLLLISVSFLGIFHISQSGQASRLTQQNARIITEVIQRQIRSGESALAVNTGTGLDRLCVYDGGYVEYAVDAAGSLKRGPITQLSDCLIAPATATWTKLNDGGTKVRQFMPRVDGPPGSKGGLVTISLAMTGLGIDDTELDIDPVSHDVVCKTGSGTQFCSVTKLVTAAQLRGGESR